jgi:hypothetical protein
MSEYKYINPIDQGYTRFKLTKKQHNEIFKNRKLKWNGRCEYYYNDKQIIIHTFTNWKAILLTTILLPMFILLNGIANIKEIWEELLELYNQKETGSFISDFVSKTDPKYNQIMDIIKSK